MKKTFTVEIEYEELENNLNKNADVLYAESLEAHIDNLMFDYRHHKSIIGNWDVKVKQVNHKES